MLLHEFSYRRVYQPDGPFERMWRRSYLRIGGFRLGILGLHRCQWGVRGAWRWSWRGVEIDTGPFRFFVGWMATSLRADN